MPEVFPSADPDDGPDDEEGVVSGACTVSAWSIVEPAKLIHGSHMCSISGE